MTQLGYARTALTKPSIDFSSRSPAARNSSTHLSELPTPSLLDAICPCAQTTSRYGISDIATITSRLFAFGTMRFRTALADDILSALYLGWVQGVFIESAECRAGRWAHAARWPCRCRHRGHVMTVVFWARGTSDRSLAKSSRSPRGESMECCLVLALSGGPVDGMQ